LPECSRQRASRHGRGFDIEGLVVFDNSDGFAHVHPSGIGLDCLQEQAKSERIEKRSRLRGVRAVAEVEDKGLQPAQVHSAFPHDMVRREKNTSAVDAAREADANRFMGRHAVEPLRNLFGEHADIELADSIEIGKERARFRRKKSRVHRVGVGAADELNLDHVMGRNHSRVAGMKLRRESFVLQPVVDRIDARCHNQHRALGMLGEEVAHGPIERPSHFDRLARLRYQSKGARDLHNAVAGMIAKTTASLFGGEIVDLVRVRVGEIDDSFHILMGVILLHGIPRLDLGSNQFTLFLWVVGERAPTR
jgi:hypothetical protein